MFFGNSKLYKSINKSHIFWNKTNVLPLFFLLFVSTFGKVLSDFSFVHICQLYIRTISGWGIAQLAFFTLLKHGICFVSFFILTHFQRWILEEEVGWGLLSQGVSALRDSLISSFIATTNLHRVEGNRKISSSTGKPNFLAFAIKNVV